MAQDENDAPPSGLTAKQRACLEAIEAHNARTGSMPSMEELRRELALNSKNSVLRLLQQLEERGRIARLRGRQRAIRLLSEGTCPRCGAALVKGTKAA